MLLTRWTLVIGILAILETCAATFDQHDTKDPNLFAPKEDSTFDLINGTSIYRFMRHGKETKAWFDGRDMKIVHCVRKAKCEQLNYHTCLGSRLPYTKTSLQLTYFYNQEKAYEKLEQYRVLMHVPKCWAVIQPFLCATFMPKCEEIAMEEMVHVPSLEMCRITMEPCKMIYNTTFFPEFLKCNESRFPSRCDNDVREMKFNTTGLCLPPLIKTDNARHFYDGISGCGLPCHDPLYTLEEHSELAKLIGWGAGVCLALALLTVATFLVDWKSANKYPALVIFYINVCYAVSSIGWLAQFGVGSRNDIVCSKDGTRRQGEPSAEENLSCVVVFVLVYYFLIAACVWFVIFTYAWHMGFKALGKIQERIDKKAAYFHLVAWSLPLVLTITTMALGEVDGSSTTGICFVGYLNHPLRAGLLLGPLLAVLVVGGYFLSRGLLTLITLRITSKDVISPRASNKIRETIMRCSCTAVLVVVFIGVTIACHIYEFKNSASWYHSFKQYLICRLTTALDHRHSEISSAVNNGPISGSTAALSQNEDTCAPQSRPSVAILQLQLLMVFGSGVLMASWVWTPAALEAWKLYFRRKFGCMDHMAVGQCDKQDAACIFPGKRRARKHELIARAYRRRAEFLEGGRVSISLGGERPDPVGLPPPDPCMPHTDNALDSGELSSTWAANLPRFVSRRGALVVVGGTHTNGKSYHSLSSNADRRTSQDSQISISLRHVSVESRRNSLDSQLSVKIAEVKTKVNSRRRGKTLTKQSRRKAHHRETYKRKESTTSVESQMGKYVLKALATKDKASSKKNRRRKTSLNREQIDMLLGGGKMMLPFLQNQGLTTSDEENASIASYKVKDSQLNIVLRKKKGSTVSNDDVSLNEFNIMGYQSDSDAESMKA